MVSKSAARLYEVLRDRKRWMTTAELAEASGYSLMTVGTATKFLGRLGAIEKAATVPSRFRFRAECAVVEQALETYRETE